jgi:thiol-disulfide isomerase/thioredoxin
MRKALCVTILLSMVSSALAQERAPEAMQVLQEATAAMQKLSAISYEAQVYAEGALATRLPSVNGSVVAKRQPTGTAQSVYAHGQVTPPGAQASNSFRAATDGKVTYRLDDRNKVYYSGTEKGIIVMELDALYPPKFLHADPFDNELRGAKVSHDGVKPVDGVECDVVAVTYDMDGKYNAKLYFGTKDRVLRRLENIVPASQMGMSSGEPSRVIFNAKTIDAQPKVNDSIFTLKAPEGYKLQKLHSADRRKSSGSSGLLAVGTEAPDWTLKTPDGKEVSLKSLRGRVVILDFWATWCGPCRMAMPALQKLHERFKDKPVSVFGVNQGERRPVDVPAFAKQNNLTYGQLLNGETVARLYRVTGIPCFYIIGPDGKIVHAGAGFDPRMEQSMGAIVEGALPKS